MRPPEVFVRSLAGSGTTPLPSRLHAEAGRRLLLVTDGLVERLSFRRRADP